MTFIWTYPFVITAFILRKNKLSSISIDRNGNSVTEYTRFLSEFGKLYPEYIFSENNTVI